LESTLQESKAIMRGQEQDELVIDDTTNVDLPGELILLLEANATELAFDLYKGETPPKIRALARKARVRQQRSKDKFRNRTFTGLDYGRKSPHRTGRLDNGFDGSGEETLPSWWPT